MTVKTKRDRQAEENELESRLPEYGRKAMRNLTDADLRVLLRQVTREVALRQQAKPRESRPTAVRIFGPNLSGPAQRKGNFHVHEASCSDCKHYGPGRKFQGEDAGMGVEVECAKDAAEYVYGDFEEYDREDDQWVGDFYFAPCLNGLPTEVKS